jgi:molybdopterin-guanine dinucleotide biosynthesis protein A
LDRSAIVLAGGSSTRFGKDKGLLPFAKTVLIRHVLKAVGPIVEEKVVVVGSESQIQEYVGIVESDVKVVADVGDVHSPLVGASSGFEVAHSDYCLLMACDMPLVSREVVGLLFECCVGRSAAVPRWPNCYIEPLQAVYSRKPALEAAKAALGEGGLNMRVLVERLRGVRYVSTLVLEQLDPELRTFFNVNTPLDLKKAEKMLAT